MKFIHKISELADACKNASNSIKKAFPWIDSGCNDCKYFKFDGKWGEFGGKIRHGECQRSIKEKKELYKGFDKELNGCLLKSKDKCIYKKDLVNKKRVIAIPDFCIDMRCFVWRRKK